MDETRLLAEINSMRHALWELDVFVKEMKRELMDCMGEEKEKKVKEVSTESIAAYRNKIGQLYNRQMSFLDDVEAGRIDRSKLLELLEIERDKCLRGWQMEL